MLHCFTVHDISLYLFTGKICNICSDSKAIFFAVVLMWEIQLKSALEKVNSSYVCETCKVYVSKKLSIFHTLRCKKYIEIMWIMGNEIANFAFQESHQKYIFTLQKLQVMTAYTSGTWMFFLWQQITCRNYKKLMHYGKCSEIIVNIINNWLLISHVFNIQKI